MARAATEPTVTDANVVLGYLPAMQKLGGDMTLEPRTGHARRCRRSQRALKLSLEDAALGIYNIVNENMFGALRLVSVEQGYDPRDFALDRLRRRRPVARQRAGAPARILAGDHSAGARRAVRLGDATTRSATNVRGPTSRNSRDTNAKELAKMLEELASAAAKSLVQRRGAREEITTSYQVDMRYHGQGLRLTIDIDLKDLAKQGLKAISDQFDAEHKRLFTFALDARA